jgi:hypothetical protein
MFISCVVGTPATDRKTGFSEISEIRLFDDESPWSAVHWNPDERRDYDLQLFRLDVPSRPVGNDTDNRT